MFRLTQQPSSGSKPQYLAKITNMVRRCLSIRMWSVLRRHMSVLWRHMPDYGDICRYYGDICRYYGDICRYYGDICRRNAGLFEMTVGALTTCHVIHNTLKIAVYVFFYLIEKHSKFLLHTLQVLYMCTLCDSTNINTRHS